MLRDYQVVSPSLDGVLSHTSLEYEGLRRPIELLRVLDGPSGKNRRSEPRSAEDQKVLCDYFHDVYGIFMKKLSHFVVVAEPTPEDTVKLQALLQELIKIKGYIRLQTVTLPE